MKHFPSFFFLFALGALAGCTQSKVVIGGDDAGADSSADGGGVQCGPATCTDGLVCCNESCGICTAPGEACITLACEPITCGGNTCDASATTCCPGCGGESFCSGPGGECPPVDCPTTCDDLVCDAADSCCVDCDGNASCSPGGCPPIACDPCAPMDARSGVATCALLLGYAWSGGSCEAVLCTCTGADCGSLYSTESACVADHESCTTTCSGDADCDDEEWCNPCAHGSCPLCEDCVQDCAPHSCATGRDVACRQLRPDCGETGVAVVGESLCWECVDLVSCEPLPDDCRVRGCEVGRTCEACPSAGGTAFMCVPAGAAC